MGVTTDLVKHYQDSGIVSPEVNTANKYRYYTIRHGERIVASRKYREMGFGLQDTRELLYEKDAAEIQDMLYKKQLENEENIRRIQLKNESLVEMQHAYKELLEKAGSFEIKEDVAYYYVTHVVGQALNEDEAVVEKITDWMEHLDFAHKAYMVSKPEGEDVFSDRYIGFVMQEKYFTALGFAPCQEYMYLPVEKRLIYYYRGRYDKQLRFATEGVEILKQAQEQGYEVNSESFIMHHLFDDHVDGIRYTNYIMHFFLK